MPSFTRTLVGIVPLCDANLSVISTKHDVKAIDQAGATILKGWIIPPPDPPPEPLPPTAIPVPNTYWDRIRHERRTAGTVQLTYREWLDQSLVNPADQNKR
jgi:hypothetical protein